MIVGTKLSEGLSDQQLDEFESFIDRKSDRVSAWLATNAPNYEQDAVYQQLRANAPDNVPVDVLLAEYASLKWLGMNRPNYRDVVAQTMNELKQEIIANRDAILGGDASAA